MILNVCENLLLISLSFKTASRFNFVHLEFTDRRRQNCCKAPKIKGLSICKLNCTTLFDNLTVQLILNMQIDYTEPLITFGKYRS